MNFSKAIAHIHALGPSTPLLPLLLSPPLWEMSQRLCSWSPLRLSPVLLPPCGCRPSETLIIILSFASVTTPFYLYSGSMRDLCLWRKPESPWLQAGFCLLRKESDARRPGMERMPPRVRGQHCCGGRGGKRGWGRCFQAQCPISRTPVSASITALPKELNIFFWVVLKF